MIWGMMGVGKTTLAGRLGEALGVPAIDLDAIKHADGWDSAPEDQFVATVTDLLDSSTEGWVIAGGYRSVSQMCIARCDTIVWMNLPWRVSFWRLSKRTFSLLLTGKSYFPNSPARDTWAKVLFTRHSLLWRSIYYSRIAGRFMRRGIAAMPERIKVYELRTSHEVESFLKMAAAERAREGRELDETHRSLGRDRLR